MNFIPSLIITSLLSGLGLVASLALADVSGSKETQVIPSPDKAKSVLWKSSSNETGEERVTLRIGSGNTIQKPWTFSVTHGRGMVFSWSPDAHYLLVGVPDDEKSMTLYYLNTTIAPIKEHDLHLSNIEPQVAVRLPNEKQGNFAPHEGIEFDRIEWLSSTTCHLPYFYECLGKRGTADLELNLTKPNPQLVIGKIAPNP